MSDFSKAIGELSTRLETVVDASLEAGAKVYQKNLSEAYGTYALAQSVIIQGAFLDYSVIADKPYAYYLEYGNDQAGPYIQPNGKALHFQINGKDVFVKKIKTYAGKGIAQKALDRSMSEINLAISSKMGSGLGR